MKKHLSFANVLSCVALFLALSGAAYAATLGKNAVKAKNIAKNAVTSPKLKNASVTTAKLANGSVVSAKLGNGSVISGKIANGAVTTGTLVNGAVVSGKLGNGAVTEEKLSNNAVSANKLAAEAVTTGKLGKESVTGEKLSAGLFGQLVRNVSYVTAASGSDAEDKPKAITATCPAGKEAIGGGARVTGAEVETVAITESFVTAVTGDSKRTGWTGVAKEIAPETKAWGVEAVVICAEL